MTFFEEGQQPTFLLDPTNRFSFSQEILISKKIEIEIRLY
jgi:hypothetical protein